MGYCSFRVIEMSCLSWTLAQAESWMDFQANGHKQEQLQRCYKYEYFIVHILRVSISLIISPFNVECVFPNLKSYTQRQKQIPNANAMLFNFKCLNLSQPHKVAHGNNGNGQRRQSRHRHRGNSQASPTARCQLRRANTRSARRRNAIQVIRGLDTRTHVPEIHQHEGRFRAPLALTLHPVRSQRTCCVCVWRVGCGYVCHVGDGDPECLGGVCKVVDETYEAGGYG